MRGPKAHKLISCASCQRQVVTRWSRQKYCEPCGIARRSLPASVERVKKPIAANRPDVAAELAQVSVANSARGMADVLCRRPDYIWRVHLVTDYSLNASKNRRWSNNGRGGVFLSSGVRDYQSGLIARIKEAVRDTAICQNKVWIGLFVQKENHRSDAINVIDTICDAVKVAIDLDDRWFCIDQVDWEIVKRDPKIFISIGQTEGVHKQACSHCGQILTLDHFGKHRSGHMGRQRSCFTCARLVDQDRRAKRKAERKAA